MSSLAAPNYNIIYITQNLLFLVLNDSIPIPTPGSTNVYIALYVFIRYNISHKTVSPLITSHSMKSNSKGCYNLRLSCLLSSDIYWY